MDEELESVTLSMRAAGICSTEMAAVIEDAYQGCLPIRRRQGTAEERRGFLVVAAMALLLAAAMDESAGVSDVEH